MPSLSAVHLNGLRAVEAVARRGSLSGAAEELGVSSSAVSQQVARTERQIGKTIFQRTHDGLVPTEFGAVFIHKLSAGFRELSQAVALTDDNIKGALVVSVAPVFASRWLVPRVGGLHAKHPEIFLRIETSARLVDFDRSDVDLAIRLGDGKWPDVKAELLFAQRVFPVCAPAIAKKLKTFDDIAQHSIIRDASSMFTWDRWFELRGATPLGLPRGCVYDDPALCLEAAVAGQGVTLAWELLVADALAQGRLTAPFGTGAPSDVGYYLVTPAGRRTGARVSAFKRWIIDEVTRRRAK